MRDSYHSMGLISHAALVQQKATREDFDKTFREYDLRKAEIDLPTAPTTDISIPSAVAEAEGSKHAEIRRVSREREFSGLPQAHTFGPAKQSIGNVVGAKWLFNSKCVELGWIRKAKSRLVARGLKQRKGI